VRFLVDANLPPALARWLVDSGHEAEHVTDLGAERFPDRVLWERARELGACVITRDEDFVLLHALDPRGPAVVWELRPPCAVGAPRRGLAGDYGCA
jgi:predicted nuclease of predicted toxin-antitoxin system